MRGRKRTPTAKRVLQGNPQRRPLNRREPDPPPMPSQAEAVAPPELVDDVEAGREWCRVVPLLRNVRVLTEADRAALILYCLEWSRYLDANKQARLTGSIIQSPSGYPIVNPYLAISRRAFHACHKMLVEFGLTPSSRSRLTTLAPGGSDDDFNEFLDEGGSGLGARH